MLRALMLPAVLACAILLSCLIGTADPQPAPLVAPTGPRTPEEEKKGFHLPPGFDIDLVAAEPDINKPMNLNFDARGRLWVTSTVEYPYPAPADRTPRDSVKILEDFGPDGRARKITTFADGLNIPTGVMPITGGAIVSGIPNIWRLLDTDGDDRADRKEVLYGSFGYVDTHGMCSSLNWGLDGWLYATHGFANNSTLKAARGDTSITMHSGNTFRIRQDGSRIEQYTWGQVNPFGLSFDAYGNLFSADCHSRPVMMLLRGGYYQSFGKPHDGLGFAPEICGHDHSSTGIAGITHYSADQFPEPYRGAIFIGNVVTSRINHDKLDRQGSTLRCVQQPDFLVSDDLWFRPVDIKLGPDGALYVADFYNKIIGHYEVPLTHPGRDRERGRIWRIFYRGTDGKGRPSAPRADWTKAAIKELVEDLAHPNLIVRTLAANQLVERGGEEALPLLKEALQAREPVQRAHAAWILQRLGKLDAAARTAAAQDQAPLVRTHAMRILAESSGLSAAGVALIRQGLQDAHPLVRRAAADALGMHPAADNLPVLLEAWQKVPANDPQLLHTIRMALRNQLRDPAHWSAATVDRLSEPDARNIADVALGVPSAEAAAFLLAFLVKHPVQGEPLHRQVQHAARHGSDATRTALVEFARNSRPEDLRHQVGLLRALQQGFQARGAALPREAADWAETLTKSLLASGDAGIVLAGLEVAGSLKLRTVQPTIATLCTDKKIDEGRRAAAASALIAIDARTQGELLGRILRDGHEPVTLQEKIAGSLAATNSPETRAELVKCLPSAPARLQTAIAMGLAGSPQGAESLLEAVAGGKASPRLLQERPVLVKLEATKLPKLAERLAALTRGLPPADQRAQELLQKRRVGFAAAGKDAAVGARIFEKNCAACHQLAGKGSKVGPQLDGIGIRGVERLLEDLLDPNRNVDQAFRASTILRTDGQLVTGLVLREEGEVVVVADAQGKEQRVPKGDIQERKLTPLSPMPANLQDQVPEGDFYHLLAYLLAQRGKE